MPAIFVELRGFISQFAALLIQFPAAADVVAGGSRVFAEIPPRFGSRISERVPYRQPTPSDSPATNHSTLYV